MNFGIFILSKMDTLAILVALNFNFWKIKLFSLQNCPNNFCKATFAYLHWFHAKSKWQENPQIFTLWFRKRPLPESIQQRRPLLDLPWAMNTWKFRQIAPSRPPRLNKCRRHMYKVAKSEPANRGNGRRQRGLCRGQGSLRGACLLNWWNWISKRSVRLNPLCKDLLLKWENTK